MRAFAVLPCLAACAPCLDAQPYEVVAPPRDWLAHPAIVDLGDPPPAATTFAVSDIHGGNDRFLALLAAAGIASDAATWTAGDATLVVAGDLIDKGPQSLEVLASVRALAAAATAAGGRVVVTLGNHEAEFLADPTNCKAGADDGVDGELRAAEIDPRLVASGGDPRGDGAWLRDLPFGVRVGRTFFAHAGATGERDLADLAAALEADVTAHDYRGAEVVGDGSILESRDWFAAATAVAATLAALDVDRVVFGHSPHALGPAGAIAVASGGALVRIDCGMSPDVDDSRGEVLAIRGGALTAIAADGTSRPLD